MSDETEPQPEIEAPEAPKEAIWEPTGGGWYENSITGERVRGKKNIPGYAVDSVPIDSIDKSIEGRAKCIVCNRETLHDILFSGRATCRVCGEVNA